MSDDKMRVALEMARDLMEKKMSERGHGCEYSARELHSEVFAVIDESLASAQQAGPAGSVAHGCHLDADNGEPVADDCVLDYGMPDDCSHCQRNKIERREDCEHWRPLKMAELPSAPPSASVVPDVIRIGGEDFPMHIALEALGVAMNTTLTSGLQGFADRIKNDLHWSQYFEADHALLMEAIAELKRNRQTQPAALVVPEEWRQAVAGLVDDIDGLICESSGVCGLHLNGDMAPWSDLTEGGRFERLTRLEAVRALLAAPAPARAQVGWSACHEGHYTPSGRAEPEQREKVELTDAEIEDIVHRRAGIYIGGDVLSDFRAVIAAHEAKLSGVAS